MIYLNREGKVFNFRNWHELYIENLDNQIFNILAKFTGAGMLEIEKFHNNTEAVRFKKEFIEAYAKRQLRFWSYEDFVGGTSKKQTPEDNLPKKTTRRKPLKR